MKEYITIKTLREFKKQLDQLPEQKYLLVPKKVAKEIDKLWDRLPLWEKVLINISRIFKGVGLYKKL